MPYIGNTPTQQSFVPQIDYFSGNGSQTQFTLSRNVASVAQVMVVVNNVPQKPGDAFTVLNNVITFTGAPSTGSNNIYVYYTSLNQSIIQPGFGTVGLNEVTQSIKEAFGGMGFKNRIINGAMAIDQRNAGASVTLTNSGNNFIVDRFQTYKSNASVTITGQRSNTAPVGFSNSILFTATTGASIGASDEGQFRQAIEGFNIADLAWGTASASPVSLSFWVRSSLTGSFAVAIQSNTVDSVYVTTYTVNTANTWEYKTITIAGPTSGIFSNTNGVGFSIIWDLGAGSNYSTTANVWTTGNKYTVVGTQKVMGTTGATFYITGVQLEKGSTATSFDYRPYGTELALCQRYLPYYTGNGNCSVGSGYTGTLALVYLKFPVSTRVPPSGIAISSPSGFYVGYSASVKTTNLQFNGSSTDSSILLASAASGLASGQSQIFSIPSGQYIYFTGCEL